MRQVHESDVCIIGGGITSAMLCEKLAALRPGIRITVVEAGKTIFDFENRGRYRQRALDYGEHPWHEDYIEDQQAKGIISMTMALGGLALHWGAACNRFSVEDTRLRSMYGLAVDWPIEWADLERCYVEAEQRLNVAGEPSPYAGDERSAPYPQPPVPLSWNLQVLKGWAEKSGLKFNPLPSAKQLTPGGGRGACCVFDTCGEVCPSGSRYSPDWTFKALLANGQVVVHDRTLVRRLAVDPGQSRISVAQARHQDRPEQELEYRAPLFVVASGYCWSSHLLLLSRSSRYPDGIANSSGLVGRYMNGHPFVNATAVIDEQTFPGQYMSHSLISREYFRCATDGPFVRHDTRVWESSAGREARLRGEGGRLLLGDEVFDDWRGRISGSAVRLRAYLDMHPSADSRLTLDPTSRNRYGDPLPTIQHHFDAETVARQDRCRQHVLGVFEGFCKAGNGRIVGTSEGDYLDHPGGGCRMGDDPATSVVNSYGRTHDHENLFVIGAPTTPTGGCTNGTLTFVALTLRSAEEIARSVRV
ncbi:MAG: GMC oxidoreductase [Vicinamibacterales bacterium]